MATTASRRANPLALAVLSCLWERSMYPYEITTTLRERGKEDSIRLNFGSLYAVIKSLEKRGLIVREKTEREGNRPERVVYGITDSGRREAIEWLRDLLALPQKEYPAIEAGLSLLAMLPPAEAAVLLRRRLESLDADIRARDELLARPDMARIPELFVVESHYRIAVLRAEREFLTDLVDRIESGSVGGAEWWNTLHRLLAEGHDMNELSANSAAYFGEEVADLLG
jgi:DNA-binding PadR family transcriptional regulator